MRMLHSWDVLLWIAGAVTFLLGTGAQAQVTTSQYNNARTGAYLGEKILSPQNVNAKQFGRIFKYPVDGDVYAQPLFVPAVEIPGKGTHDVLYIATENDGVYAFDAEANSATPLWQVKLASGKGVAAVPAREVECPFIRPVVGIT